MSATDGAGASDPPGAGTRAPKPILAMADAYVRQEFPDENHGLDNNVRAGSGSTTARANRTFMMFDLAGVAGCDVTAAQLSLYYASEDFVGISPRLEVDRVTASWSENSVTWNSRSTGVRWTAAGGDFDAVPTSAVTAPAAGFGWLSWNMSSLVAAWLAGTSPNFGIEILEPNDNPGNQGRKLFASAQSGTSPDHRPFLAVTCR
jgi:hypothetical protein